RGQPMMPLTPDAVRDWVGDFEMGKGRPYADAAVTGETTLPGGLIRGVVRGSRPRPYRVEARAEAGAVAAATCTCPVGEGGRCKHVAAVLLAYVAEPGRFTPLPSAVSLTDRPPAELVALVHT